MPFIKHYIQVESVIMLQNDELFHKLIIHNKGVLVHKACLVVQLSFPTSMDHRHHRTMKVDHAGKTGWGNT